MPHHRAKVIINPASGSGAIKKRWPRIERMLTDAGLIFDYEFTLEAQHGVGLARDAVERGYGLVVVVGGDGTVNEVVNGLVGCGARGGADLGVICTGTANDFAHSLGLPKDLGKLCRLLTTPRRVEVDVGVVECFSQGGAVRRLFINVAGAGFDAAFMQAANPSFKPLGAKLPYIGAFLKTITTYGRKDFLVSFQGERERWRALGVLVSNGKFAATMPFHPDADLADGQFEVMALDLGKILQAVPPAHFGMPDSYLKFDCRRVTSVEVESTRQLPVEADGEVLGELPARFYVLPKAIKVVA